MFEETLVKLQPGSSCSIFLPVRNTNIKDTRIQWKRYWEAWHGTVQPESPAKPSSDSTTSCDNVKVATVQCENDDTTPDATAWRPPIDTSFLTPENKKIADDMLREEAESFAQD